MLDLFIEPILYTADDTNFIAKYEKALKSMKKLCQWQVCR